MPECVVCEEDVPRSESPFPSVSRDNTVALSHAGCEAGEKLPLLLREGDVTRATHVCEACVDEVETRRVRVTGAHREQEFRKQFRCPGCGDWARYDEGE
jgi:hypothetical protein